MSNTSNVYSKLLPSGLLDKTPIRQPDFDVLVKYIKRSFPKATTLQRDVEQTLKRTFVLGGGTNSKASNSFRVTRKSHPMSSVKRRSKRSSMKPVPKNLSHDRFVNLNRMWNGYVADLLRDIPVERVDDIQQKLSKVDLHGAQIEVTHSICKDFIGLKGIVIKETRNTFVIISKENLTKTLPKSETEFRIETIQPLGSIVIAGNSFLTRPAERASKKIKSFMDFVGARIYKSTLKYSKHS